MGRIFKEKEEEQRTDSVHKGDFLFCITGWIVGNDINGNGRGTDVDVAFYVRADDWQDAGIKGEEYLTNFNSEEFGIYSIEQVEDGSGEDE